MAEEDGIPEAEGRQTQVNTGGVRHTLSSVLASQYATKSSLPYAEYR